MIMGRDGGWRYYPLVLELSTHTLDGTMGYQHGTFWGGGWIEIKLSVYGMDGE